MNQIVKNTREELLMTTNSNQLLMTENMRNITKALEVVKDNLFGKMSNLDKALGDMNNRVEITNAALNEHTIEVRQSLENEFKRVDKVLNRFEDVMNESTQTLNDRLNKNEEKDEQWKKDFEVKNHSIFQELTNAMKSMKKNIGKVNRDSLDRDEVMKKDLEANRKMNESLFKTIDEKVIHLESLYNFRLNETTKVWENRLQIEVDKMLDALSKNNDIIISDYDKKIKLAKKELGEETKDKIDLAEFRLMNEISTAKKLLDESTISKIKDVEARLNREWVNKFEDYKTMLDDNLRELAKLKNDLELIKKDYYNQIEGAKQEMKANISREVENVKSQVFNRVKEHQEQIEEAIDQKITDLKQKIEHNKEDMERGVQAAKIDVLAEVGNRAQEIKNMVDKNDQIIHNDVNTKMNLINGEISTMKHFLVERMDEMNESTKSIARALVNEEAANRVKQDEHIIKLFDRKINNLNALFLSMLEQKLDELRIQLENKIKDALIELEEFKRWTYDEFSNVRDELETFKQETYCREYQEHLYNLVFQKDVGEAFNFVDQMFTKHDRTMEKIRSDFERNDQDLLEKLGKEKEHRQQRDNELRDIIDDHKEIFDDYKDLNEKTWEEFILEYHTNNYTESMKLHMIEVGVYDTIEKLIQSLGAQGGDISNLEKRLKETQKDLGDHKEVITKQDKANAKKFKEHDGQLVVIDKDFEDFKTTTESNFAMTEQALSQLSNFCNIIDSRLTTEELMSRCCLKEIEDRSSMELGIMNEHVDLQMKRLDEENKSGIKKLEKKIIEDTIPSQILLINQNMGNLQNATNKNLDKVQDQMQSKISEHTIKLEKHDKELADHSRQLNIHEQKIKHAEENLNDAGEDLKKIGAQISDTNAQVFMDGIQTKQEIAALNSNIELTIKDVSFYNQDLQSNRRHRVDILWHRR